MTSGAQLSRKLSTILYNLTFNHPSLALKDRTIGPQVEVAGVEL